MISEWALLKIVENGSFCRHEFSNLRLVCRDWERVLSNKQFPNLARKCEKNCKYERQKFDSITSAYKDTVRENIRNKSSWICKKLALVGDLPNLKRAHEAGCLWKSSTIRNCIMGGNFDCLKYVTGLDGTCQKYCEWSTDVCDSAVHRHIFGNLSDPVDDDQDMCSMQCVNYIINDTQYFINHETLTLIFDHSIPSFECYYHPSMLCCD
jgi:hypothetical protein